MPRQDITIDTSDGACPASLFTPEARTAPWPAVIHFMDGLGIRPPLWEMGQQLADAGYLVLLPDLYYRHGHYARMDPHRAFSDEGARQRMLDKVHSLGRDEVAADATAFVDHLDARGDVCGNRHGAVGYCMGGTCALWAAGALPGRFAAIASIHGGSLATGRADSPHRFLRGVDARVHVIGAIEDAHFDHTQKQRLQQALVDAGIEHVVETYLHARHGFAVRDMPRYNPAAAARHWPALLRLFAQTL